ncbi:RsfA family transcriptional regulator [Halalkalibacterium ligniniphilum]|uniref:RsfA family transcriptional regulator n=1 Tax=Halalkalibacterium ligniniphilum TaxID=1134413 RepID=UPI0003452961|nr:RsfA family transcriptional regulator [Halalkalibacterium ligniniphilum]
MSTIRQDAWSSDEDLILAEVVLRHIREGSTQLSAFEEVGERLSRTSAACGFRWNSTIRKKYEAAISLAKKQRKKGAKLISEEEPIILKEAAGENPVFFEAEPEKVEKEESLSQTERASQRTPLTMSDVIAFLKTQQEKLGNEREQIKEKEKLERENDWLREKNQTLEKELSILKEEKELIREDYQTLISIMERARKLSSLERDSVNTADE